MYLVTAHADFYALPADQDTLGVATSLDEAWEILETYYAACVKADKRVSPGGFYTEDLPDSGCVFSFETRKWHSWHPRLEEETPAEGQKRRTVFNVGSDTYQWKIPTGTS